MEAAGKPGFVPVELRTSEREATPDPRAGTPSLRSPFRCFGPGRFPMLRFFD